MISFDIFRIAIGRAQSLPVWARYLLTVAVVAATFGLRAALSPVLSERHVFLLPIIGILASATLFDRGAGLIATSLSGVVIIWLHLVSPLPAHDSNPVPALLVFLLVGVLITLVIEGFQAALRRLKEAHLALAQTDAQRRLLLNEFRHRSRNDLQSLVALLLLRARAAPSPAAQDGLREAAEHARALARVHTLLAQEALNEDDPTQVDSRGFVEGLAMQLSRTHATEGLRPISLIATAEAHPLDSERAILVGLVLNECVTNALKYAFPDERPGKVLVRFIRTGADFVLDIEDDGTGTPVEDLAPGQAAAEDRRVRPLGTGLGTRLLRGMAAQLRGSFNRGAGQQGTGTRAELRFPAEAPGVRP